MRSTFVLRWVLVALGAALGIVLLAGGHVVIGALVLAMAVTRGVLLAGRRRRRRAWLAARAARGQRLRALP